MKKVLQATFTMIKWLFLIFIVAFSIYPVFYALSGSLMTNQELQSGGVLFPSKAMFSNYAIAFYKAKFAIYTLNSVYLCIAVTAGALLTSSMTGYCIARYRFPGSRILLAFFYIMMFVAMGPVVLMPQYELMKNLGLTDSLWGLILVMIGGQASNIVLTSGYIKGVPKELDESALIDGCGKFRIYWNIVLPLIKPVLGVVGLFTFRNTWNDYITPLIFTMSRRELQPITVAVVALKNMGNAAAEWNIMVAGAAISIIPVLIAYLFTNKQFIAGLTAGAVKG